MFLSLSWRGEGWRGKEVVGQKSLGFNLQLWQTPLLPLSSVFIQQRLGCRESSVPKCQGRLQSQRHLQVNGVFCSHYLPLICLILCQIFHTVLNRLWGEGMCVPSACEDRVCPWLIYKDKNPWIWQPYSGLSPAALPWGMFTKDVPSWQTKPSATFLSIPRVECEAFCFQ